MNCRDFKIHIEEQDAEVRERWSASEHLTACIACRKLYDEHAALRRLMRELEVVPAPSNFDFRLRARLAVTGKVKRWTNVRRAFAPGFASIALAAGFALTFGITLFVKQASRDEVARLAALSSQDTLANQTSKDKRSVSQNEKTAAYSSLPSDLPGSSHKAHTARKIIPRVASNPIVVDDNRVEREAVSSSFGVEGATLYIATAGDSGAGDDVINLPVSAGALEVSARDDGGAPRKVSLKSVSFGGQEIITSPGNSSHKLASLGGSAW